MFRFLGGKMPRVKDITINMGCDPEFFFRYKGEVVGAEKLLPKTGLKCDASTFIIDGVQAELNPRPNYCRANLGNEIVRCFRVLLAELNKSNNKGFTADFSRTVEIPKENLMELDEKSRKFGCAPSQCIYKRRAGIKIDSINPEEYRVRAAGGHLHFGLYGADNKYLEAALKKNYEKTVAMLDILVGNTAVLIDRNEGNIERRKVYGRAGEYRLPTHGLEYRTLSNFWLTSYPLLSFVFGMARFAIQLMADPVNSEKFYKAFTNEVWVSDIHKAINNNDFDLAYKNFKAVEPLILESVARENDRYAIHKDNIREFHHFVKFVNEKGLEHFFPDDPIKHWTTIGECHQGGFHDYLITTVRKSMQAYENRQAKAA